MTDSRRPPDTLGDDFASARVGQVIAGKFRVERILGEGGMGIVVAARHLQLDESVALKFLHGQAADDPEALARFSREAKAAAKLKSEHVARVLDYGVIDDRTPYIVMEYLEGQDLGALVRTQGPLDPQNAAEYAIEACEGLAEAHARGIVHRDIKPENLFLANRAQGWQAIKILDFGISKFATTFGESNLSTRNIMGSPCYMSPEQLRSTASVDHRTDIWSLGVTLFELLSGRTAYDAAQTFPELVAAILEKPAPRLAEIAPNVDADLAAVVDRCMAKDREQRIASAAELAMALLPFAPKRARAAVERAIAVSGPRGLSSQHVEAVSRAVGSTPGPTTSHPVVPTLVSVTPSGEQRPTPRRGAKPHGVGGLLPARPSPAIEGYRAASLPGSLGDMATVASPRVPWVRPRRRASAFVWAGLGFAVLAAVSATLAIGRHPAPPAVLRERSGPADGASAVSVQVLEPREPPSMQPPAGLPSPDGPASPGLDAGPSGDRPIGVEPSGPGAPGAKPRPMQAPGPRPSGNPLLHDDLGIRMHR
jgi:serine/threonine-protein kinase